MARHCPQLSAPSRSPQGGRRRQRGGSAVQAEGPVCGSHRAGRQGPAREREEWARSWFWRKRGTDRPRGRWMGRDAASPWPALTAGVCLTMAKLLNVPPVGSITQLPCFPETHRHGKASAPGHERHISAWGQQKLPPTPAAGSLKVPRCKARLRSHLVGRRTSLPSPCPAQPEPLWFHTQNL